MTQAPIEYAALNFDGTERRANYRTVAYRIDILHLCERRDAAAILFEIIYRWQTEVRKPEITKEIERRKKANMPPLSEEEVEGMMWVWMSYNDFVRECGGAVAYNTVIRTLDYLVETVQIVECRENHDPRYPDYEYRVRLDVVKKKLKALPSTPAFMPKVPKKKSNKGEDSTQVGIPEKRSTQKGRRAHNSTQVGIGSTQKGIATTQDGREVYPDGGTSHITHIPSHIQHTEERTYTASSSQKESEQPSNASATANADRTHTPNSFALSEDWLAREHAPKEAKEAHEQHNHDTHHGADASSHHPARNTAQVRAATIHEPHTALGEVHPNNGTDAGQRVAIKLSWDSADGETNYVGKVWPDGSVTPDYGQPRQGPAPKARSAQHARWQKQLPSMLTEESLTPTEQRALHTHLAECPECTQLDAQRQAILAAMREQAAPKAQLSTSEVTSPQARAKVEPKSAESVATPPQVVPVMPPADAEWKTTTCLLMFNAWRGVPLLAKYQCMKASQCAKALVEHYTREQVERVRTHMVERDEWWSLHPEKVDVCTVAEHIHEILSEIGRTQAKKQASAQGAKPTSTMSGMRRLGS